MAGRFPEWCDGANATLINAVTPQVTKVTDAPAILVGVIVTADGATDTTLRVFDQKEGPAAAENEKPGCRTTSWNGYVNMPQKMANGIVAHFLAALGANTRGWVIWIPLPLE